MSITLTDFLATVSVVRDLPSSKPVKGVEQVADASPYFVEPTLSLVTSCPAPSVVLVAAPAAVGKTMIAREIAHRQNAPYWDLAKFQVGDNTFTGTLGRSYAGQLGSVLTRLADGEFLIVIDALDEAHVRAGTENLEAFLSDLVEQTLQPRSRPVVIVLGRVETIDWADYLFLSENNVPYARYKLDYFDNARAVEFIDKRLDQKRVEDGGKALHRQSREQFENAREDLFRLVYELLAPRSDDPWSTPEVGDFLGYAPVLEALAGYLGHPNLQVVINQIADTRSAMAGVNAARKWHFLRQIVSDLQVREQKKMHDAVTDELTPIAKRVGWNDWMSLYSSEEQSARLLADLLKETLPEGLPVQMLPVYNESVKNQLLTHPFKGSRNNFASIVFEEYLYAWAMARGHDLLPSLRDKLASNHYRPTPLLAHFIATMRTEDGSIAVDGEDFGYFYDSMLAARRRGEVCLNIADDTGGTYAELEPGGGDNLTVNIRSAAAGIHFGTSLSFADISVDVPVHLGRSSHPLIVGPGVHITCSELFFETDHVEVLLEADVSLSTSAYHTTRSLANMRLSFPKCESKGGTLKVWWPSVGHPWSGYKDESIKRVKLDTFSPKTRTLIRLLQMFSREKQRAVSSVETARLDPQERRVRDDLIQLALKRGVLKKSTGGHGPAYHFNTDFASLKSLSGVPGPELTAESRKFAQEFLGDKELEVLIAARRAQ